MKAVAMIAILAAFCSLAAAQPFQPGQGVGPTGTWRTSDYGGPYNVSLLPIQANEVAAGGAARMNFTDHDIVDFLTNVECLEGLFDTWGAFGRGFLGDLELGGPTPIGAQKANLSAANQIIAEEIALQEQGHALFTRHAGGANPCPQVDFTNGFNEFFAAAYGLNGTVQQAFGSAFNPFLNDQNFFLSVVTLEELGATGNKGLALITSNPVIANGIAGLATTATAQAAVERLVLWNLRTEIVEPFGETVAQVFARVSALRDSLDGPQLDDQGLIQDDSRFIAVPDGFINLFPTDIQGISFSRVPQMLINILTLGSADSKGAFFPNGLLGAINSSVGYNNTGNGLADFPTGVVGQGSVAAVGVVSAPITGAYPPTVPDEDILTQAITTDLANSSYITRGYLPVAPAAPNSAPGPDILPVLVGTETLAPSTQGVATTPTAVAGK